MRIIKKTLANGAHAQAARVSDIVFVLLISGASEPRAVISTFPPGEMNHSIFLLAKMIILELGGKASLSTGC